jgi:maltoporin
MSKNLLRSVILFALVAVFALSGISFADDSFEYHGYMRTGFSTNEKLYHPLNNVQATNTPAKYRLGNESNDIFIENSFVKNWKDDEGQWAKAVMMFDWHLNSTHPYGEDVPNSDSSGDPALKDSARIRQAYVQMGGFEFAKSIAVWAGLRYYHRSDVHINDFYYRDLTGYGIGVEKIDAGFAKIDFAWITSADDSQTVVDTDTDATKLGKRQQHTFDLMLDEIKLPGGSLQISADLIMIRANVEDSDDTDPDDSSTIGYYFDATYGMASFLGIGKGFFKVVGQYAMGAGTGGAWLGDSGFGKLGHRLWGHPNDVDASAYRVLLWGTYEVSENISLLPVFIYENASGYWRWDNSDDDVERTWMSAGLRLKYNINRSFAVQFEIGYDACDGTDANGAEFDSTVMKYTIAPTFTFDTGFWTRPEIRLYATYATWDKNDGMANSSDFNADDESAMQFGAQAEAWW